MASLVDRWQERLMPIANKVGNQRFLVALRDSFIGTMPVSGGCQRLMQVGYGLQCKRVVTLQKCSFFMRARMQLY